MFPGYAAEAREGGYGQIINLAAIAAGDKDYASSNMLAWFVDEQVEEEESARDMITACEAVEGNKFRPLHARTKELAARHSIHRLRLPRTLTP